MTTTRRLLAQFCVCFAIVLVAIFSGPAMAQSPDERAFVESTFRDYRLPAAAVIVIEAGKTKFIGFGQGADGEPITDHARFYIGSLSKAFTAAAVLQLVERGKVVLDQPVQRYLREFRIADPRAGRITVRQLLNQTSGMSTERDSEWQRPQPQILKAAVARLAPLQLGFEPGSRFSYHNPNYTVAARLVEVVSGMKFSRYMRENIFLPLGMRDTATVDMIDERRDRVALGHIYAFGHPYAISAPDFFVNGAGGIVTTPADYAKWHSAQMQGGVGPDGARILTLASITAAHTPAQGGYGFGWNRTAAGRVSHSGGLATFGAYAAFQKDRAVAVFVPVVSVMAPSREVGLGLLDQKLTPVARGRLWILDAVLAAATLLVWGLSYRGVSRSQGWAQAFRQKGIWRRAIEILVLPGVVGVIIVGIPLLASQLLSWSWIWLWYYLPVATTFLLSCAVAAAFVTSARASALFRVR